MPPHVDKKQHNKLKKKILLYLLQEFCLLKENKVSVVI